VPVRLPILVLLGALIFVASSSAGSDGPPAAWLAQARCVHAHEGPWTANTGNGHFGGMQFSAQTWLRMKGRAVPAFRHPGDPLFPFTVSPAEQLRRAWLLWLHDGRSWRSWGSVGALCS
jgi:Transglycosylase-like domain